MTNHVPPDSYGINADTKKPADRSPPAYDNYSKNTFFYILPATETYRSSGLKYLRANPISSSEVTLRNVRIDSR